MYGARRIAVVASMVGMLMGVPAGLATAHAGDGDAGAGGVLSNLSGGIRPATPISAARASWRS